MNGLWQLLQDTIDMQIKNICVSSANETNTPQGSNKQKIGDFFKSGMDSLALNEKGISDILPDIAKIDSINSISDLIQASAYAQIVASSPLFSFYISQDEKMSSKNVIYFEQGGLNLPDREYYFATDSRTTIIRNEYFKYITNLFERIGNNTDRAKLAAEHVLKLETALAKSSRKREDTRDPLTNYNNLAFDQWQKTIPNVNIPLFIKSVGLSNVDSIVVGQPEFFTALNNYLTDFTLEEWKDYLKFDFINSLTSYLDDKTYALQFNFYSTTLRGVHQPKPRWKRVVSNTNSNLGKLIGQVYVNEYLPNGTKEKLLEIGHAVQEAYAQRIKNLDWMSEPTKEKALFKLNHMIFKVGYPDKWTDMSTLKINDDSYVKNVLNANKWFSNYMLHQYGKPVDRTEWGMNPQDYNAYYNSSNNEIVVPGCNILVPGYEHVLADDAILYSIIGGSTFGHEMTHGFDDQGSKYNVNGNLENWWTPNDSIKFYEKTHLIVKQFNEYIPVDSLHINGENTQGENIADLGGITIGYQAFKKTKQYQENKMIAGLNPNQRFFLAYGYAWMMNQRPEYIANQVRSDEHSPAKYRVIGPLSNMPEFYDTFGVKPGDAMWRSDSLRGHIW